MSDITINDLTTATVDGTGVFDVLMKATNSHLEKEFKSGRITGTDYSTVYLGALTAAQQSALEFVLSQEKAGIEADNMLKQGNLIDAQMAEVNARIALINEQTESEAKQNADDGLIDKQIEKAAVDVEVATQQKVNLVSEKLHIDAQTDQISQETINLAATKLKIDQDVANAVTENTVLVAQECKLRAEYDLLLDQKLKTVAETALLSQKKVTEKAQTDSTGVDPESVIGKQTDLYRNQADGFIRDAEQKTAKILSETWNVRRTTDTGTTANSTNQLDDAAVGRAINKLLTGVNA